MNKIFIKNNLLVITMTLCFALLLHTGLVSAAEADVVPLQILTVNDFHGALLENGKNPGAAKIAAYLKDMKAQNPNGTLILSAGDMFQGSADSNLLYGKTVVEVMNEIGFDAMTLGNHEFDWGVPILKQRIAQSHFPYLSANIIEKATGNLAPFVKPYALFERSGIKIAVIGMATPQTAYKTSGKTISPYEFEDPTTAVNALLPKIKQEGADVIIVLSHLDSFMDKSTGTITGEAATLAMTTNGIDAIVSGHSHQIVYGIVHDVPIVQAHYFGRAVGCINLAFDKETHQVTASSSNTVTLPFDGLKANPEVKAIIDQSQSEIIPVKNKVLGRTVRELSHNREIPHHLSLLGQWTADRMREATHVDIAFENEGGIRTNIPAGDMTMGRLYEVFPFDNTLVTMELTGSQIMKVLEHGILNTQLGMVQFSGINVIYDQNKPKQQQLTVTLLSGKPLDLTKTYKVVTNDFLAAGGDNFIMFKEAHQFDTNIPLRDMLAEKIQKLKVIDFNGDHRLIEKPLASTLFRTAA